VLDIPPARRADITVRPRSYAPPLATVPVAEVVPALTARRVSRLDDGLGVLVAAMGSSNRAASARTASVASKLTAGTRWASATTAFATRPEPSLAEAANRLRRRRALRVVIAPWFLAPGRLPDRVRSFAADAGIEMAAPLGAHRLVAETVLDRFDQAAADRIAA
jgi:sirohydrochlorin ferrochelatase